MDINTQITDNLSEADKEAITDFKNKSEGKKQKFDQIDHDFMDEVEGHSLYGKVPSYNKKPLDKSGVTISRGLDLGHHTIESLQSMGLDEQLIKRFKPYLGLKGIAAEQALKKKPLIIEQHDSEDIKHKAGAYYVNSVARQFEKKAEEMGKPMEFFDLTPAQQTVLYSVNYQYGSLSRTPKFFTMAAEGNWKGVHKELLNFGDKYTTRRGKEADLLYNETYNPANIW
jgi:hypothetical protein